MFKVSVIICLVLLGTVKGNAIEGVEKCNIENGLTSLVNCAATRILRSVEKAEDQHTFEVLPGIELINENAPTSRNAKKLDEITDLPEDPQEKTTKLLDLLIQATLRFFSGRTLKLKLPEPENVARALEEGRGKMKKMMNPMMLLLGLKAFAIVPILIGGLGLLATKALITAKIAFVLAAVLFIQGFLSGKSFTGFPGFNGWGVHGTNSLGWNNSPHYGRSLNIDDFPVEQLAYTKH